MDIILDKLGSQTTLVLKDAGRPKKVERVLIKFQDKYAHEKGMRDHNALKDMLSAMIAYHVQGSLNWGLGAALGMLLLRLVLALYILYDKVVGIDNMKLG